SPPLTNSASSPTRNLAKIRFSRSGCASSCRIVRYMECDYVRQKTKEEDKDLSLPYIHPLVRQSKSCCLSEKSLEICTESLGSETGSEGFSSNPSSVAGDNDEEGEGQSQTKEEKNIVSDPPTMQKFDMEDLCIAKLNSNNFVSSGSSANKKAVLPNSFPPPIPSLARGAAATETLHMRPHCDNGRLVLEAVSCASRNNFRAQREHGRLVLTFVPNESTEQIEKTSDSATAEDQFEVEFENSNPAAKDVEEEMEMDDDEEEDGFETEEENKFEKEVMEVGFRLKNNTYYLIESGGYHSLNAYVAAINPR
ncbi:Protein FAF-like, chloroplastic, partial [Linum grandiflorum]